MINYLLHCSTFHKKISEEAVAAGVTRFIGSSGGNAGMAMAVAAKVPTHPGGFTG